MQYLCLDVGGSSIKWGLVDETYTISRRGSIPNTFTERTGFLDAIITLFRAESAHTPIDGVAVSYCGELDPATGTIYNGGAYQFNDGFNLKKALQEVVDVPVTVENDGNCVLLAETTLGSLKGYKNCVALAVGSGCALSLFLDGKLHYGSHCFSGLASICLKNLDKEPDFDNMLFSGISAAFLCGTYQRRSGKKIDGKTLFKLADGGDALAKELLDAFFKNLARFIFNLQMILDVEAYAIGGGISAGESFINNLNREFDRLYDMEFSHTVYSGKPVLKTCSFFNDAGLIGALCKHRETKAHA